MEKPKRELKTFAKTRVLHPGESQTVSMAFRMMDLASFEESDSWVVDAGEYEVEAGASVEDIRVSAPLKVRKGIRKKVPVVI